MKPGRNEQKGIDACLTACIDANGRTAKSVGTSQGYKKCGACAAKPPRRGGLATRRRRVAPQCR